MNQHRRIVALAGLSGAALFAAWRAPVSDGTAPQTLAVVPGPSAVEHLPTRMGIVGTDRASGREISSTALMQGIAALPADASWAPGQLVVRAESPEALVALAERFDAQVAFGRHRSGTGVLQLASDGDVASVRSILSDELGPSNVGRNGIIRGAAYGLPESPASLQWHLDAAEIRFGTAHSTRVAVLDSGVAYRTAAEAWSDQIGAFFPRRAPSLLTSPMVDPWDFVANDPFPDDEYWHGTHIASVLASSGQVVPRGTPSIGSALQPTPSPSASTSSPISLAPCPECGWPAAYLRTVSGSLVGVCLAPSAHQCWWTSQRHSDREIAAPRVRASDHLHTHRRIHTPTNIGP